MFRILPLIICITLLLSACSTTPPKSPDNICNIFSEKKKWYKYAAESRKKWGTPISVMMSIMYQESSFQEDAKPGRTKILWVIPWKRKSSSYGYAQALKGTWERYQKDTGNSWADRDSFKSSIDFIGWYINENNKKAGIAKNNAYANYLAYHEGQGGYSRGTYKKKKWLRNIAWKVKKRSNRYYSQLTKCEHKFKRRKRFLGIF